MTSIVIDPTTQTISVDGREIPVAFDAPPEIRRITWEGKAGAIEYRAPQPFGDFAFVQPYLDLFDKEAARLDLKAEAEAKVAEVQEALNAFPDEMKIELAKQALQEIKKIPLPTP